MRTAPAVSLLMLLVACGGGGNAPSGPSVVPTPAPTPAPTPTPAPVSVPVIDGWTHAPVAAAVNPPQGVPGTQLSVTASGFLPRQQAFDGTPVALWSAPESYVGELVYGWDWSDGVERMVRWDRPFVVTLEGGLAGDAEVVAKVQEVLAEIERATGFPSTLGAGGAITVTIDATVADDDAVGITNINTRNGAMSTARVRMVSRRELLGTPDAEYSNTFLHEMGHAIGLSHSPSVRDVMTPAEGPGTDRGTFTDEETQSLHMMYAHRRPGNLFVDREVGATGAAAIPDQTFVIID
jgi:hypothetical protein